MQLETINQLDNMRQNMRTLMGLRGLNGVQLAAEVGIPDSYISEILNRRRIPTTDELVGIARGLKVSFELLVAEPAAALQMLADLSQEAH